MALTSSLVVKELNDKQHLNRITCYNHGSKYINCHKMIEKYIDITMFTTKHIELWFRKK